MIKIVTQYNCPYCDKAEALLAGLELTVQKSVLDTPEKKAAFKAAGFDTVPQIYVNGKLIGGHSDLVKLLKESLLNAPR